MRILTFYDISNIQLMARASEYKVAQLEADLLEGKMLYPGGAVHVYIQDLDNPHLSKLVMLHAPRF